MLQNMTQGSGLPDDSDDPPSQPGRPDLDILKTPRAQAPTYPKVSKCSELNRQSWILAQAHCQANEAIMVVLARMIGPLKEISEVMSLWPGLVTSITQARRRPGPVASIVTIN